MGNVSDTFTWLDFFQRKITLILTVWLGTLPKLFLFEGSVTTEGLMERHMQCGCMTGQCPDKAVGQGH